MKTHGLLMQCLSWLLAFALGNGVLAQSKHELTQSQTPLEQLHNREGTLTLSRSFHGQAGWELAAGSNDKPRFMPVSGVQQSDGATQLLAMPGDENWDDRFGTQGLNGGVMTIAVSGSEVYVGGRFTVAGTIEANNIAKWDGAHWSALGSGVNGQVSAIAIRGNEVYAGGWFTTAGGVAANYIAKWDGVSWSALGNGIGTGEYWGIFALAANETEVYVGGQFTTAGEVTANNIAKWDGTSWSALGSGMNGDVHTLAISGDTLYAGGGFSRAGGVAANRIAMWDGMNWSPLGSGTDNTTVRVIAVSGSKVYAGGEFIRAGDVIANYIAEWDGTSWSAMGGGVESLEGFDQDMVFSLAVHGNEVYAGGLFIKAGGVVVNRIAKWDGASWSALGSGVNSDEFFTNVFALAIGKGELYAGGTFTTAGDKPSWYFGRYVLNTPPTADAGPDQQICNGKSISIGGSPTATDGTAPYTYSWAPATGLDNATAANPLASPTATTTYKLIVTDANSLTGTDEVTVTVKGTCKRFVFLADKVTLKSTKQITPAGDIHSNGILTLEKGDPSVYNSNLTAVGKITIQKDNAINGDVTSPLAISNAGTINGTITVRPVASEPLPSKSYSAGGLNRTVPSGGSLALAPGSYNLVTLNSGGTLRLTSGDYFFNELRYPGSEAVIEFDLSSGNAANVNIVSNFQFGKEAAIRLLPNGESDSELVTFFTLQSTAVSIGKEAYFLGTLNAPNALVTLVKNSQLRGSICAKEVFVDKDCLFLHHDSPGSLPGPGNLPKPSSEEDGQQETSNQQPVTNYQLEQNSPNPFNPVTTIQFSLPRASHVRLKVYNTSGAEVAALVDDNVAAGTYKVNWDASRMASGFYLYRLEAEGFTQTKKLLLMK